MRLPVISRYQPEVTDAQVRRTVAVAQRLKQEDRLLEGRDAAFQELVVKGAIDNSPALIIDDFSEIPIIGKLDTSAVVQQRARLRAAAGDWLVQSQQVEAGYSDYCEYRLDLGRVNWLYPANQPHDPHQVAIECWQDRRVRHDLIQAVRHEGLRYIHPHLSTLYVWELASLLTQATRIPVQVIGPLPHLSHWVNDKIEFILKDF